MLRDATGTPRASHVRDGRGIASTEMASCVPLEPRPVGLVHPRSVRCRAGSAQAEGYRRDSWGVAVGCLDTRGLCRDPYSCLERYAGPPTKSSAARVTWPRSARRRPADRLRGGPDAASRACRMLRERRRYRRHRRDRDRSYSRHQQGCSSHLGGEARKEEDDVSSITAARKPRTSHAQPKRSAPGSTGRSVAHGGAHRG